MISTPPSVAPTPPSAPLALRALRFLALLSLVLSLTFLVTLAVLVLFPRLNPTAGALVATAPHPDYSAVGDRITVALIVLLPPVLLFAAHRFRLGSWRCVAGGWLAVAPVLAYLATDEPELRHPLPVELIAPSFPDAARSRDVLQRYGKGRPAARAFVPPPAIDLARHAVSVTDSVKWHAYVTGHRAEFAAGWAALAPQRAWWAELNAFERLADLSRPADRLEVPDYPVFRSITHHALGVASLQALDGHGDDAVATLLPVLQVGRKLLAHSRTSLRTMLGLVVERMSLEGLGYVLDHASISPAARARLIAALQGHEGEAGARRLIATEYTYVLHLLQPFDFAGRFDSTAGPHPTPWPARLFAPLLYNHHATFNRYGDFIAEIQELAAHRDVAQISARSAVLLAATSRPRFKNYSGTQMTSMMIPNYAKVTAAYWQTEDARAALLIRLTRAD
jgi:hypothetical protein